MVLLTRPAHSTKDWLLCLPQNGITPTAPHYAGYAVVWLSPSYVLLSSPLEELDHHADMPSGSLLLSTSSTSNPTFHLLSNSLLTQAFLFLPLLSHICTSYFFFYIIFGFYTRTRGRIIPAHAYKVDDPTYMASVVRLDGLAPLAQLTTCKPPIYAHAPCTAPRPHT